jgi:hypothetical protein
MPLARNVATRDRDDRSQSRSVPTRFRRCGPHRHRRNEAIPIWHLDLRQTLGIHDVALLDDAVAKEQIGGQSVHFVRTERSRLIRGHSAVDIVPSYRRIRVIAGSGFFGRFKGALLSVGGSACHQTRGRAASGPIRPVATRAPLRKKRRAFLGGSSPGGFSKIVWGPERTGPPCS